MRGRSKCVWREPANFFGLVRYPVPCMKNLTLLFVAGGLGTLARYGLSNLIKLWVTAGEFPFATTIVNALGCLMFGVAVGCARQEWLQSEQVPIVLVGFLGAFTTFSTFAFEAQSLWRAGKIEQFCLYLAAQNVLGILCVAAGLRLTVARA